MNNVKRMLKKECDKILPRKELEDEIKKRLYEASKKENDERENKRSREKNARRKSFAAIAALPIAACLFLCVYLPVTLVKKPPESPIVSDKFALVKNADSFYAYGAMSVGLLLSASVPAGVVGATTYALDSQSGTSDNPNVDELNKYMLLVEGLLSNETIKSDEIAEKRGYDCASAVNLSVLYGDMISVSIYYDKMLLDDDSPEEEYFSLKGLLVLGTAEYSMDGTYHIATEGDEIATEMRFTAYTDKTRESYIVMQYETSEESEETETEYEYITFIDGEEYEKVCVSYETEDGETSVKTTLRRGDKKDVLKFCEKTEEGVPVIRVKGSLNDQSVAFDVETQNGKYNYKFSNGTSIVKSRFESDDDDDSSDDDKDDKKDKEDKDPDEDDDD